MDELQTSTGLCSGGFEVLILLMDSSKQHTMAGVGMILPKCCAFRVQARKYIYMCVQFFNVCTCTIQDAGYLGAVLHDAAWANAQRV